MSTYIFFGELKTEFDRQVFFIPETIKFTFILNAHHKNMVYIQLQIYTDVLNVLI